MNVKRRHMLYFAALSAVACLGAAAIIGIGVASSIEPQQRAATSADPRQGPQLVQVAAVKPAAVSGRTFTGVVSARVQSNLGFRVAGKVIERLVDAGQTVAAGQPLLRLDRKDLRLALTAKENVVTSARASVVQARADEKRYRQLRANGWSTRQKYDQAKAALDSAEAQLTAAEALADIARNEVGYSLLLADADGTIVETLAEPGQVVAAGQTVVRLAHAGPREATVYLPETMRPAIGSPAQARLYGASSPPSPARLRQLADAADPSSRTYDARYVLEGDAARAPLGATVTITIMRNENDEASEVPLGAIYDDGKSSGVWVYHPTSSSVSLRPVRVRQLTEETAIVSGVSPGESVVALGAHLLHQGERVRLADGRMAAQ